MVTLKLKKPAASGPTSPTNRSPVRGSGHGVKRRPTLAEAQRQRAERDAQPTPPTPPGGFPHPTGPRENKARDDHRPRRTAEAAPRRDAVPSDRRTQPLPNTERTARGHDGPARGNEPARGNRPARAGGPEPAGNDTPARRSPARPAPAAGGFGPARPQPVSPQPSGLRRPFDRNPPDRMSAERRSAERHPPGRSPSDHPPRGPAAGGHAALRRQPQLPAHDEDDDDPQLPEHPAGSLRLSKRMSELGIASRREADEWIAKGWVRVDDRVVSALGSRVMPGQRVTIDAQAKYQQAQKVTVLINKPVGYVSGQAEDGYEPAVVLVTPANQWQGDASGTRYLREHTKNLVPAGRLDIDSVGLLVLTQDGRVAKQLIGDDSDIEKEYLVRVASAGEGPATLAGQDLERLRHGLELDGEALRPATVEWVNADQLRFVLRQGKKRQIRRMCEAVGLQVLGLKRVRIGQVMLGDLPPGQWRYLRREEGF